jgi:hypothetical protein
LANLSAAIPTGVMTFEIDTGIIKVGDGATLYAALPITTTLATIANLSTVYAKGLASATEAQSSADQASTAAVAAGSAANLAAAAAQNAASSALAAENNLTLIAGLVTGSAGGVASQTLMATLFASLMKAYLMSLPTVEPQQANTPWLNGRQLALS